MMSIDIIYYNVGESINDIGYSYYCSILISS